MPLDINPYREQIEALCRQYHVRRLAIFGSARRNDFDPETSDLDLLVEFQTLPLAAYGRTYLGLLNALADLFRRPIDLLEEGAVQNPFLKRRIEAEQTTIYAA
jgi:predicted nucleotidyltransferase